MTEGDTFVAAESGIADGSDLIVDASSTETGAVEVHEFSGTGSADIYREVDTDGDDSWAVSNQIDSLSGEWHSQQNQLQISQSKDVRLRITNTSGNAQDYFVTGLEVADAQE